MTKKQRAFIWFGIFIILAMCLFPPWNLNTKDYGAYARVYSHTVYPHGYHLIFHVPQPTTVVISEGYIVSQHLINLQQLKLQIIVVIIIVAGAIIALSKKGD